MNMEMPNTLPKIENFPYLSPSLLKEFAAFYTPNMGQAELTHCQRYFSMRKGIPPTEEELAFLDAFVGQNYRYPDAFLISQMQTEDAFLAETFHDLMDKRAAAKPNYSAPCSFEEITKVAQKYLEVCGKKPSPIDTVHFRCQTHPALTLAAGKVSPVCLDGDTECGLFCGKPHHSALVCRAPLANGDTVYAILKSTDDVEDFEKKLLAFAKAPSVLLHVKKLFPVGDRGLIHSLFDTEMGFEVELSRLYGDAPATRLLEGDLGLIFIAKKERESEVLMDALDAGLRPRLVGALKGDDRAVLNRGDNTPLLLTLPFLKALAFSRAYRTEIPSGEPCHGVALSPLGTACIDGQDVIFARADGDDSRHAALYAALCALASCVGSGVGLRDIRIAARTKLSLADISTKNLGKQLALLLGLYRAETEFELTELDSEMQITDESSSVTLYAVSAKPQNMIPDTLVGDSSAVYLLEPRYDSDGNPDFDNIKDMFTYVAGLTENGTVLSARAVFGDILPTLDSMSGDKTVEYALDAPYTARAGSILVETAQSIGGLLVGKVLPTSTQTEENPDNA